MGEIKQSVIRWLCRRDSSSTRW